MPLHENPN